jgi:hypothetical protein
MTDKQTLLAYRFKPTEETFADAEKMLQGGLSGRSIICFCFLIFSRFHRCHRFADQIIKELQLDPEYDRPEPDKDLSIPRPLPDIFS